MILVCFGSLSTQTIMKIDFFFFFKPSSRHQQWQDLDDSNNYEHFFPLLDIDAY